MLRLCLSKVLLDGDNANCGAGESSRPRLARDINRGMHMARLDFLFFMAHFQLLESKVTKKFDADDFPNPPKEGSLIFGLSIEVIGVSFF